MKREVGFGTSAGLLAILALFLHTQLPNTDNGNRVPGSLGASTMRSSELMQGDQVVDGPWLAMQAFFHSPIAVKRPGKSITAKAESPFDFQGLFQNLTSAATPSAYNWQDLRDLMGLAAAPENTEIFSLVATVADPAHTHMALFLDEETEAIERSVQNAGWTFAQQWLPWVDRFDATEANIRERRAQRAMQREQEELPGILIFRSSSNKALFVFLVPETVTGGVNGPAFYAAMHMARLSSGKHKVGLLGPTFSGSFASLAELYGAMERAKTLPPINETVYGGTVSNLEYAGGFVKQTHLAFHGGILDSRDYQNALCRVLKLYKMDQRAAILKEDEGGLQAQINTEPRTDGCQFRTYLFPREISHLRNAYQDTSNAVKDPYSDQAGRINFSIRDRNSGEDSIPTFSETQTPLTQDTILTFITDELNRQHTHVIFISVTNPLDGLFLLQSVHTASPDSRVFIEGPHALYAAAAAHENLNGTIFLSPYPMFFEGDDWLDRCSASVAPARRCWSASRPRLMFADSAIQGLYNVTQLLLENVGASKEAVLYGYRQPDVPGRPGQPYPGMWLLTLNRFGFLPVDLINQKVSELPSSTSDASWFEPNREKALELPQLNPTTAPRSWIITVFIVSLTIVLFCITFVRCNLSRHGANPIWLVFSENQAPKFKAMLWACFSLSALDWILALPWCMPLSSFFAFNSSPQGLRIGVLRVSIFLGVTAPLAVILFAWCIGRKHLNPAKDNVRRFIYYAYYLVPIALFTAAMLTWFDLCNAPHWGLFFRFRALDLYSGSSPALPLAIACITFFCLSVFHLRQYTLAGMMRPRLEVKPGNPTSVFQQKFKNEFEAVEEAIGSPWTLKSRPWGYRIGMALIFLATCSVILGLRSLSAFEQQLYNQLLLIAIAMVLLALATKLYDLVTMWDRIHSLLNLIEILPLRVGSAIQRIAEGWPRQPIWLFNRSVPKEAVEREMLYRLHRRVLILKHIEERLPKSMAAVAAAAISRTESQEPLMRTSDVHSVTSASRQASTPDERAVTSITAEEDLKRVGTLVFGATEEKRNPRLTDTLANILKGEYEPPSHTLLLESDKYQNACADVAANIYERELRPAWRTSLNEDPATTSATVQGNDLGSLHAKYIENCADFVTLNFCRFIAYAVGQVKRVAWCVSISFVLFVLLLNSYSPEAPQVIAHFLVGLFVLTGAGVWRVFSEMERNQTLSTMARTTAGELNIEFWIQLIALGGLPLLGILGHLFPSLSQFLFQWIAPSMQAMR